MNTRSKPTAANAEIGHNKAPDAAKMVADRLALDYAESLTQAEALLAEGRLLPAEVTSVDHLGTTSAVIVRLRDSVARAEASRVAEKEPYLRSGQAVDGFFKTRLAEPLQKAITVLHKRVDAFQQAQLIAERKRREAEQKAAEEAAEKARLKAEEAKRASTKEKHEAVAEMHEQRAEELAEAAIATPANMVRERFDSGHMVTMKQVKFAEVVDVSQIPLDQLRPYFKISAIEDAVKAWAKATEHRAQMPGVRVGERAESVVR